MCAVSDAEGFRPLAGLCPPLSNLYFHYLRIVIKFTVVTLFYYVLY